MPCMRNRNLEIRIAGSSSRPQRISSPLGAGPLCRGHIMLLGEDFRAQTWESRSDRQQHPYHR